MPYPFVERVLVCRHPGPNVRGVRPVIVAIVVGVILPDGFLGKVFVSISSTLAPSPCSLRREQTPRHSSKASGGSSQ